MEKETSIKTERQQVMEYVATLHGLDRYTDGDMDLLPEKLYAQAREYWAYEHEVDQMRKDGQSTPQELKTMQSVREIMKRNLERDLLDLLGKYGYRFNEPDSLQNNVRQRLTDLQEEYRAQEGQEATPLLVDAWCVMKDDLNPRKFRQTFQFDGEPIDDRNITRVNGTDALVALAGPDSPEPYNITQVMDMYGNVYNVEITECLLAKEVVEARTREDADKKVLQMLDSEELVLDEGNYNGVEIKLQEEESGYHLGPTLMASPENLRHVSVVEFLVKTVQREGRNRDEAVQAVRQDWKDEKIVLDADDFAYRAVSPAFQLVDNALEMPKRLFPATQSELQKQFRNRFPDGVTVHLRDESVGHLLGLDGSPDQEVVGLVNDAENTILSAYGELQAEIRLPAGDYREVWPDRETYFCEEFEKALETEENTVTTFLYRHPDLTGGRVSVDFSPAVRDALYIEGIPFGKAVGLIRSEGISTDREFKEAAAAYRRQNGLEAVRTLNRDRGQDLPGLERVSDIAIVRRAGNKTSIRCKIDGEQQMAVPVSAKDRNLLADGMTTKEELAVKYFHDELSADRSQEQDRGMKR